jgi:hypothetical protein
MQAKLGHDHPDTLIIRNNLALRYRDAGRISKDGNGDAIRTETGT